MWEDFYDDDSSGWAEDDPPSNFIEPYTGGDALGINPNDGATLGNWTINMNDKDEYTDDPGSSPSFWAGLGDALTGTLSGLAGTAIDRAGTSGGLWIKKQLPAPAPAAAAKTDYTPLILGAAAVLLVLYLLKNRS